MDDRQHLYNLIQGNKNPFKIEINTSEGTQTQTSTGVQTTIPQAQSVSTGVQTTKPQAQSVSTQSDLLSEMEKIMEMFKMPPVWRTRHQSGPGSSQYTEKPGGRTRHQSGPGSYYYIEKPRKPPRSSRIQRCKPPQESGYHSLMPSRPAPKGFPDGKEKIHETPRRPSIKYYKPPRRLVTNVRDWYMP